MAGMCERLKKQRQARKAARYYQRWKKAHPSHLTKYGHKFKNDPSKTKTTQTRRGIEVYMVCKKCGNAR